MTGVFEVGNYIESGLWWFIGVVFGVYALRSSGRNRVLCRIACAVFILFGASDVVEAGTGAWWKPWWLLAWKAVCIAAMIALLVAHRRAQRKSRRSQTEAAIPPGTNPPTR